jgi:hypothetical protein
MFHIIPVPFIVSYWFNVLLFPVSSGGGRSSRCCQRHTFSTLVATGEIGHCSNDKTAALPAILFFSTSKATGDIFGGRKEAIRERLVSKLVAIQKRLLGSISNGFLKGTESLV